MINYEIVDPYYPASNPGYSVRDPIMPIVMIMNIGSVILGYMPMYYLGIRFLQYRNSSRLLRFIRNCLLILH